MKVTIPASLCCGHEWVNSSETCILVNSMKTLDRKITINSAIQNLQEQDFAEAAKSLFRDEKYCLSKRPLADPMIAGR